MLRGNEYNYTTVDGTIVTSTFSGKGGRGESMTWYYAAGRMITWSAQDQMWSELACHPHKFERIERQVEDKYRWQCSICKRVTNTYDEYSDSERHRDKSLACSPTYPSINPTERGGTLLSPINFLDGIDGWNL